MSAQPVLPWLNPGDVLPDVSQAWPHDSDAPGLLAAGGTLAVASLLRAYRSGVFPWYSQGQPILWWSPDPRMVLQVERFRLHRSFRKTIQRFRSDPACEIRVDTAFHSVIENCAHAKRDGQGGTWIVDNMISAYRALHAAGHAHSVETWVDGALVGGLYCVAIGKAVFGESMFAHRTDASKLALAALVGFCRAQGIAQIDCQQNTHHLATLGAAEMPRAQFVAQVAQAVIQEPVDWRGNALYWKQLLDT